MNRIRLAAALAATALALTGLTGCDPDAGKPAPHATFAPSTESQGRDFGKAAGQVASEQAGKLKPTTPAPTKAAPKPLTVEERNAVDQATSYLETSAFSRKGLIRQLAFEGYPTKVATTAVDSLHVNWNQQAALQAKTYLDGQSFSKKSLTKQLEFEGFTHDQAVYGVAHSGL